MPATVQMLLSAAVVIVVARLFGSLLAKVYQPRVVGDIIAGIALGPSILGLIWPEAMHYLFPDSVIDTFRVLAQLGLVLFMFLVGLDLDVRSLRGQGSRSAVISGTSVALPFALGIGLAVLLYPQFGHEGGPLAFSLFIGAAVAITAFPVLARMLQESGLFHTRVGVIAITCAAIDDVIAWCLLAVVVAVMSATGPTGVLIVLALSAVYALTMIKVVKPVIARFAPLGLWFVLVVAFVSAWTTELLGIHAIFGAFLAGAIMPRDEQWQRSVKLRLETVVTSLLLPIFFVVVGLSTRIDGLGSWQMVGVLGLVVAVAVAGKFGGATIAARLTGEPWLRSVSIGVLMNTRGLTEIVILTVGLEIGVIGTDLFTIMVLMAIITTVMAPPVLRLLGRHDSVVAAGPPATPEPARTGAPSTASSN